MRQWHIFLILAIILTFGGPLWILLTGQINLSLDWRTANRNSTHLAPLPDKTAEAVIQAYAARSFHARGAFATHTWIATKRKNAKSYVVYQVVGWRVYQGLSALSIAEDIPDRSWYAQTPKIILDIRGGKAEKLIPLIEQAARQYPYTHRYAPWPGPNSNTFTAYIGRSVPALRLRLPTTAIGKDYLPNGKLIAQNISGTGYQFSLRGLIGVTLAKEEGLEINLFGLVFGISPLHRAIILPGFGDISI